MQKLVVPPDRYYRVDVDDDRLQLTKIGSQFSGIETDSPDGKPTGISSSMKLALIFGGIALTIVHSAIGKVELAPHPRKKVPASRILDVASMPKPMKFLIESEGNLQIVERLVVPRL